LPPGGMKSLHEYVRTHVNAHVVVNNPCPQSDAHNATLTRCRNDAGFEEC